MTELRKLIVIAASYVATASSATALAEGFTTGPLIEDFGPVANVETTLEIPDGAVFKVSFDVNEPADAGALNRSLVTAARFLNMHVRAGVAPEDIALAFVIHGKAVFDVTKDDRHTAERNTTNANKMLIEKLAAHGVEIMVCGQSAAYYGVSVGDLLPGVEMSLSAMTAHALLQQNGYTLNPF